MKKYWIKFDCNSPAEGKIQKCIGNGSGFAIRRIYCHPSDNNSYVMEINSPSRYSELDLDVNSLFSPLKKIRKPSGLGPGMSVEGFEGIIARNLGRPQGMIFDTKNDKGEEE